jgi:MoxR-like ATPase
MSVSTGFKGILTTLRTLDRRFGLALVARPAVTQRTSGPRISSYTPFGEETSDELFADIFSAISRREHILLIGPRGSGKSYAGRRAIRMAESCNANGDVDRKNSILVPGAQVIAQGNKELPRDYFFEPEFEFVKTGDATNPLSMTLRQPPLMRHAQIDESGRVVFQKVEPADDTEPDAITRYRTNFTMRENSPGETGRPTKSKKSVDETGRPIEHFVLFLDEINRFNDGVLDTLLLLLEERCVIYQGRLVEMPVSVVATMNPPGYDISARSLSPPLLSRFTVVKQLYTAGPTTLVSNILPDSLKMQRDELARLRYEVFAVAITLFWGEYDSKRPSGAYLSPDAQDMIAEVKKVASTDLADGLRFISLKSNYGPDARGTRDWIAATRRRLIAERHEIAVFDARTNPAHNAALAAAAIRELSGSVANKLVLNFSPEAKPDEFRKLMQILSTVTYELFVSKEVGKTIRKRLGIPPTLEDGNAMAELQSLLANDDRRAAIG